MLLQSRLPSSTKITSAGPSNSASSRSRRRSSIGSTASSLKTGMTTLYRISLPEDMDRDSADQHGTTGELMRCCGGPVCPPEVMRGGPKTSRPQAQGQDHDGGGGDPRAEDTHADALPVAREPACPF